MNKYLLLVFCLSLILSSSFAQSLNSLENNQSRDFISSLIEVQPNKFVYLHKLDNDFFTSSSTSTAVGLDTNIYNQWLANSDSANAKIVLIDKNTSTTKEFLIKTKPGSLHSCSFFGHHIKAKGGFIYFIGTTFNFPFEPTIFPDFNQKILLTLYKFDSDLNLIQKVLLQDTILQHVIGAGTFPTELYSFYSDFTIKDTNRLFLRANYCQPYMGGNHMRTVEYDTQNGQIVKVSEDSSQAIYSRMALLHTQNNHYIGTALNRIFYYDSNVNELSRELLFSFDSSLQIQFAASARLFEINNEYYLPGILQDFRVGQGNIYNTILKVNVNGNNYIVDTVMLDEIPIVPNYPNLPPDHNNNIADIKYANYCYVAFSTKYTGTLSWTPLTDTAHILVSCADINGVLKWNKLIGGDASYEVSCVTATADSGCIITAYRRADSLYSSGRVALDIYYTKLDRFGNVQPNYIPVSTQFKELPVYEQLVVYPNPARDILYIKAELLEEYSLQDMQGKLIKKGEYDNQIDISNLASGTYLLKAKGKSGKLYWTKWVKE